MVGLITEIANSPGVGKFGSKVLVGDDESLRPGYVSMYPNGPVSL